MTKVVVIGASFGGGGCATALEKFAKNVEVTLIEPRDVLIHKFGGARGLVQGGEFAKKITVPNANMLKRGRIVKAYAKSIEEGAVMTSTGESIEYDYLVCATGARNVCAEPPVTVTTAEACMAFYAETSDKIRQAETICIVGGGPVGVELAGEITDTYPDKKVSLVQSQAQLCPATPPLPKKFSTKLENKLKKRGVDVYLSTRAEGLAFDGQNALVGKRTVALSSGDSLEVDLVLNSIGTILNNDCYPSEWLDETGHIKVDPDLRVSGTENVFAVGDMNNVEETKLGYFAGIQGTLVAKSIVKLIAKPGSKLKAYKTHGGTMIVPIGAKKGNTSLNGMILGDFVTSNVKGKSLMTDMSWKLARAPKS